MNEHLPENGSRDRPLNVLLLEDSRFDAELLREALLSSYPRATLQAVRDEAGFLAALDARRWDLVLSDFELPGFSGDQALAQARARDARVPFIFVSGVIGEDNAVEMLKRGATDYVSKGRLVRLPLVIDRALREVAQREAGDVARVQLREANAVFARVVDSLRSYAVLLLDTAGVIRTWNQAAQEVFGHAAAQVVGRSFEVLFTPEDREAGVPRKELDDALSRGKADDNRWLLRSDGLRLWAEGVVVPLFGESGELSGFSKVVRDATADYRDAQALRAAKEEAERANRAKDRFLAVLSHELRTPLSPIATAAHLLERVATVPPKYQQLLPMIQRNVALEARLIEDLLDLTAISAGKVSLKPRAVDLHHLVRAVVDMLEAQAQDKRLRIQLDLQAGRTTVLADEARMQQVLWNLLRNAIKFTPEAGRIEVRTRNDGPMLLLQVADSGIGIDQAALPRIFSAFEQADREVAQRFGGLGLGLAIARGLVAEHKGEISVASEGRGKGATFTVRLPTHAEAHSDAPRPASLESAPKERGWKLLLVEDNHDVAETIAMCLDAYGYQVTHVATCADAVRAAQEGGFEVVLTDLGLPDGSGIDVGRALSRRLPVVALSGYGATPDLQRSAMRASRATWSSRRRRRRSTRRCRRRWPSGLPRRSGRDREGPSSPGPKRAPSRLPAARTGSGAVRLHLDPVAVQVGEHRAEVGRADVRPLARPEQVRARRRQRLLVHGAHRVSRGRLPGDVHAFAAHAGARFGRIEEEAPVRAGAERGFEAGVAHQCQAQWGQHPLVEAHGVSIPAGSEGDVVDHGEILGSPARGFAAIAGLSVRPGRVFVPPDAHRPRRTRPPAAGFGAAGRRPQRRAAGR